eukprot:TRINITY_DN7945_c0_g1_i1.p1 TRINITY_DN7945_c0_g1~~TRINITY_DN7945_c0_g1_i1.p1  ORF type:complete len:542 (+),score=95.54 TRINITY_DN7945_c0_g1_i1:134-1627(+)
MAGFEEFIETNAFGVKSEQYLPNENRGVTYVSRLQCVQAAIDAQLESLKKEHPNKRVAIVTFNNDVTIYLPGSKTFSIAGDKLNDYDFLLNCVSTLSIPLDATIGTSADDMTKVLFSLQEGGQTALGPALISAVGIAGTRPGSSVVLCTDGQANIGLGTLEGNDDDDTVSAFYHSVSQSALGLGVSVSIVSIKGTSCTLEHLGKVCTATQGINHEADPLKLTKNFNFILQNSIVATDVIVKMILHQGIYLRGFNNDGKGGYITEVGNATKESTITYEYGIKDLSNNEHIFANLDYLPFQVQINYTKLDGSKCVRAISKSEKITKERKVAEQEINVAVVGLHSQQQAAKLAAKGTYSKALMKQKACMRMVSKTVTAPEQAHQFVSWTREAKRLDDAIIQAKTTEETEGLHYHSSEEDCASDDEDLFIDNKEKEKRESKTDKLLLIEDQKQKTYARESRLKTRSARRKDNDQVANQIHQAQNPLFSAFTFGSNPLYDKE